MLKCANLQILSDVWCKELGQPVAVVGCKWSGANGATADRHDSRMIYICLFVCWFKIQEGLPEGGYSYQHPSILCLEHVWSGANGATADRHDSRMIYICLFVCWFKIQEGLPEGGYSYQHPSILCLEHVWSGANGATANCHDSRMIYVCWFA